MSNLQTTICINNISIKRLDKLSNNLRLSKSKLIQILLRNFFMLSEEDQRKIIINNKDTIISNL